MPWTREVTPLVAQSGQVQGIFECKRVVFADGWEVEPGKGK